MKIQNRIILLISFLCLNAFSQKTILLETEWEFKNTDSTNWRPAKVPGVIHLNLLENGIIQDPYVRNNEIKQQWIERENWEYKTIFYADDKLLENDHLELVFKGLDTYASVYINGINVLEANNMFREWIIDLKPILKKGDNEINVKFRSPLTENQAKVKNSPYELPAANETVDLKVSPYTRKAAYQFGWDWGPRFVSSGIWRPVFIRKWNDVRIKDISYQTDQIKEQQANLSFTFEILSNLPNTNASLNIAGSTFNINLKNGLNIIKRSINIDNPKLWNPINYGNQHGYKEVYNLTVQSENNRPIVIQDSLSFFIRKIELVNEPDAIGTSFYFKVNNVPFYAKGANYIPQDIFPSRVDSSQYEYLIKQAVDANFNMIRVWGGGIYENDYFYDLCDQYGLLVWQDFMFANSMYPKDNDFKENIKEEIEYNVKRLRNHPCIALWCGNNEIEVAWGNWGWKKQYNHSKADSTEIWNTYTGIFHELIPELLADLDNSRDYVPTTPLSNWGKPENFNHSSMHYWGVWHGREPIENFSKNVGRFIAEYGYQSFPSYETLRKVLDEEDFDLSSDVMKNRQKSYIGNGIIVDNVLKYAYDEPNFEKWIDLTQLVQGHAMGFAIRQHRIQTPHCMGTLFWQLNDCWPGPSWSVIDYYGNHKSSYDEVKKYYQPIIASLDQTSENLGISIVSDLRDKIVVDAVISIHKTNGKIIGKRDFKLTLTPLETTFIPVKLPQRLIRKYLKMRTNFYFSIQLKDDNSNVLFEDDYYPDKNATIRFPDGL